MFNLVIRESNLHNDKVSKYSISNSELFDPVQPQQNNFGFGHQRARKQTNDQYVSNDTIPIEKRQMITNDLMKQHVVEPFISVLQFLVNHGADQHARV